MHGYLSPPLTPYALSSPPSHHTNCITMLTTLLAFIPLLAAIPASASPALIEQNLAYRSPYLKEPGLAIDTHAVHARHLAARAKVHEIVQKRSLVAGLALSQEKRGVHEDNGEVRAPEGEPAVNSLIYGLGVAKWDHDWVFGGDVNFTHGVASGTFGCLDHGAARDWTGVGAW